MIGVGMTGNLLSFLVFLTTHLRRQSSSIYLASLAAVDFGYLITMICTWLNHLGLEVLNQSGPCQLIIYLKSVFGFLSVYNVVSFTVDRFLSIQYPLRRDKYCRPKKAKCVVFSLLLFAIFSYAYKPFLHDATVIESGIPGERSSLKCFPKRGEDIEKTIYILELTDSFLMFVFPSIIIVVLNIRIALSIRQVHKLVVTKPVVDILNASTALRRTSMQTSLSSRGSMHIRFSVREPDSKDEKRMIGMSKRNLWRAQSSQYKTIRMLLIVSTVFVLLNMPLHSVRMAAFWLQKKKHDHKMMEFHTMKSLLNIPHDLNFSINFFLYAVCLRSFRSGLKRLWMRLFYKCSKFRKCLKKSRPPAQVDDL